MKKMARTAVCILLVFASWGCTNQGSDRDVARIDIDFVYDINQPRRSPEIRLANVPLEAKRLRFFFVDATNGWEHGRDSVSSTGSGLIEAGSLEGFKGFQASMGGFPKFTVSVEALDENGRLVGEGSRTKRPPEQ